MPAPTTTYYGGYATTSPVNIAVAGIVSTDLLLLVISKANAGTLATPSGLGATWNAYRNWQVESGATKMHVFTATGVSGSGNITITTGCSAGGWRYSLLVVHDLNAPGITAISESTWYAVNGTVSTTPADAATTINTDEGPASIACDIDQVAVFLAVSSGAAAGGVFPSNPTPSGWTTDVNPVASDTNNRHSLAHRVSSAVGSVQANYKDTVGNFKMGTVMLILGTATPPPSGHEGWGIAI